MLYTSGSALQSVNLPFVAQIRLDACVQRRITLHCLPKRLGILGQKMTQIGASQLYYLLLRGILNARIVAGQKC